MLTPLVDVSTLDCTENVVPEAELQTKALAMVQRLEAGPTRAHAVTKRLVRASIDHGLAAADQLIPELAPPLFETQDLQQGIASLLEHGPGQAKFSGR